ncbi:MAG TPA: hypothetical protein VKG02_00525 [Blastocatellia bacterium]|nr:hypothetical protein [Blastocatellia bacterium]
MKLTEARLKEIWQEQTARATPRQAECLTEELFERLCAGDATSQERTQAASHLAFCSDCAAEYRILRSLRPLAEQAEAILAASDGAPWIGQRSRAVGRSDARPASFWRSFATLASPARATFALAALLLISLALGLWLVLLRLGNDREIARLNREMAERDRALASVKESLDETRRRLDEAIRRSEQGKSAGDSKRYEDEIARLRQTVTELSRPQLDAPIIDLDPSDQSRGNTAGEAARIEAPPTANIITLILNISSQPSHSAYAVEILDSTGKQVWRGQRARNGLDHAVNLTISRRMIPAGRYLIKLYGLRDGKQEPVADYPVLIAYR